MPANPPDPGRRNAHSRRAILDAAISLIGEVGYDNVAIEEIARRACVGKQTIYRWWPSKGAVILEAAIQSLDPVAAFPDTGDIVADLRTQLTGILEVITTTGFGPAYQGLVAACQSDPDLMQAVFDQIIEPSVTGFSVRVALAQQRGEIRADADVATLREVLYGFIEYRLLHALPLETRHLDAVLQIGLYGVR